MNTNLLDAIKAAQNHKKISKNIINSIKPGTSLKSIAYLIENQIKEETEKQHTSEINHGIAFPVGLSLNNCAAHFTPNFNDSDIILTENDIIKIDFGVHKNGVIIDSAFTLHFNEKYDEFIKISKDLTNFAVSQCGVDVILGELGAEIEDYIKNTDICIDNKYYKLKTMADLSGHLIRPYEIHAGKAVPNIAINYPVRMCEHEFYAIEPFITTGNGRSILKKPNSHYMLHKNNDEKINNDSTRNLYESIYKNYKTLPFCSRWLYECNLIDSDNLLEEMVKNKILNEYPPIYDIDDSIISQFEHTIFIKSNGVINLTKNEFY
jgi:methionyl aminopeptidase